jgi:hypothetical protein
MLLSSTGESGETQCRSEWLEMIEDFTKDVKERNQYLKILKLNFKQFSCKNREMCHSSLEG